MKPVRGVLIENMENVFETFNFNYEIYDVPPPILYPDERLLTLSTAEAGRFFLLRLS